MNKEELIKKLKELSRDNYSDYEESHAIADDLLIEYINDKEIKDAWDNIGRWYA